MDIVIAVDDIGLRDQRDEERDGGLDAVDDELSQRPLQPHQTFVAGAGMHDELADQTVIIRGNGVAGVSAGIDPDAEPAGRMEMGDRPGRGPEGLRVLRIDAAFDGVPVEADLLLAERQRRAGRDPDLLDDEIEPGDHLGDGVLDLEARVHFDEIELAVLVQELDRADAAIGELAHRVGHGLADAHALVLVQRGRQRLLPELLVAPLQRAVALAEMDGVALAVAQHLDLDMAGMGEIFLEIDGVVAERGARLVARG